MNEMTIALADALHIKSAEFWVKLGQPQQALRELQILSRRGRKHPWAGRVWLNAVQTALNPLA